MKEDILQHHLVYHSKWWHIIIRVCSDLFIYCNPKHCLKSFKVYDCLTLASICSWPVMADLDALFSSDTEVRTTYVNVLVACHCLLYLQ